MVEDRSVLTRVVGRPDQVVRYGPDPDHVADIRFADRRAGQRPLVILVHGGFWRPEYDRAHTAPMAVALAAASWTTASIEYRRIPGDPAATLDDVARALREIPVLAAHHNGRVLVVGHSAGGHLTLWAAAACANPNLVGALALAPAADLQLAHDLRLGDGAVLAFLGVAPRERADLDPRRMPAPTVPTTIVHGDADAIVPLALAESYRAAQPTIRLIRVPDSGHFALIDPMSAAWPRVVAELSRLSA